MKQLLRAVLPGALLAAGTLLALAACLLARSPLTAAAAVGGLGAAAAAEAAWLSRRGRAA